MKLPRLLFLTLLIFITGIASSTAQSLTPDQKAKLDSLPPAIRAQALDELRKLGTQSANQQAPITQPVVVTPNGPTTDSRTEENFAEDTEGAETEDTSEDRSISQDLKQFGYELFSGSPTTFAPATDIPIPINYVMGPGDQLRLQLFGKESASYDMYVSREGVLQIPELGPISVTGMTFSELKEEISRRVSDQMIGVQVFVTLGELRSIRIFMLGDVNRPGAYTVSSLSTMTNALFVSGGIRPIGSLRNVQLKRAGEIVNTLDLYDLLLRGDTSSDFDLEPGDVIFVPPVGELVGVAGEVKRPAIYELAGNETIMGAIEMAGGFTPQAFPSLSQIERISDTGAKEIQDVDIKSSPDIELRNGDMIRIFSTIDRFDNYVRLEGAAERPGDYQWTKGLTLSDLIPTRERLLLNADLDYALVVSKNAITGDISTRSFSPEKLLSGNTPNLTLHKEDRVILFKDIEDSRQILTPIIAKLRAQSTSEKSEKVVAITGRVKYPGDYPLDEEMNVDALVRAAGGYTVDAYTLEAELLRFVDNGKTRRESVLLPVDLANAQSESAKLRPFDQLLVKRIPDWNERETITLSGEIQFPGEYTIERGETLASVINRAGGLTELAHPDAAILLREKLRKAEALQIARLKKRLQEDITTAKVQEGTFDSDSIQTAEGVLTQLEDTEATGRLVINLQNILQGLGTELVIQDEDQLIIPQKPNAVTIVGSVNYPTSHLYQSGLGRDEYISLSGGTLKNADKRRIYVVKANGEVHTDSRSRFFPNGRFDIEAGDTIVVPIDVDRVKPLKYWGEISQIIYQIALGAAAVNSL